MNNINDIKKRITWLGGQVQKHATIAADAYETASFFQAEKERLERELGEDANLSRVGKMIRAYEKDGKIYIDEWGKK